MSRVSRRGLARLALAVASLWAARAATAGPAAAAQGLGGTGASPDDPDEAPGRDRGIGGTGVVGTIQRFGSIVVNDLRIGYPANVRVTIDGVRATAADLRIGHVVRVLARAHRGALATRLIVVKTEVVGPVEALAGRRITVLGQKVISPEGLPLPRLRHGTIVAVSGLRQMDGTIVASLIVPKPRGTPFRLAGPVTTDHDGAPTIGGRRIEGVGRSPIGHRVVLAGGMSDTAFRARSVTIEPDEPFAGVDRLSIEGYVALEGNDVRFGSGLAIASGHAGSSLGAGGTTKAVVTARRAGSGLFTAAAVRVEHQHRGDGRQEHLGPAGQTSPHAHPGAAGPGNPGPANDGSPQGGPGRGNPRAGGPGGRGSRGGGQGR